MRKVSITGVQFLRFLAKRGIPASSFAHKTGCQLKQIYALKGMKKVPYRYIEMLRRHFGMEPSFA